MSTQSFSDQELIESYLSGNHHSLEVLIHRHKKRVFSYIQMVVKDKHLAEDLFQDTFIKVVNLLRSGSYSDQGKFIAWVMRIAHNLIIDHFRVSKHLSYIEHINNRDLFDNLNVFEHSYEDKIVMDQTHKKVKSLMEFLPPEQKEMIVLRHYYDMSFKDIAEELNISINTAIGRLRYALINMRKLMEKEEKIISS